MLAGVLVLCLVSTLVQGSACTSMPFGAAKLNCNNKCRSCCSSQPEGYTFACYKDCTRGNHATCSGAVVVPATKIVQQLSGGGCTALPFGSARMNCNNKCRSCCSQQSGGFTFGCYKACNEGTHGSCSGVAVIPATKIVQQLSASGCTSLPFGAERMNCNNKCRSCCASQAGGFTFACYKSCNDGTGSCSGRAVVPAMKITQQLSSSGCTSLPFGAARMNCNNKCRSCCGAQAGGFTFACYKSCNDGTGSCSGLDIVPAMKIAQQLSTAGCTSLPFGAERMNCNNKCRSCCGAQAGGFTFACYKSCNDGTGSCSGRAVVPAMKIVQQLSNGGCTSLPFGAERMNCNNKCRSCCGAQAGGFTFACYKSCNDGTGSCSGRALVPAVGAQALSAGCTSLPFGAERMNCNNKCRSCCGAQAGGFTFSCYKSCNDGTGSCSGRAVIPATKIVQQLSSSGCTSLPFGAARMNCNNKCRSCCGSQPGGFTFGCYKACNDGSSSTCSGVAAVPVARQELTACTSLTDFAAKIDCNNGCRSCCYNIHGAFNYKCYKDCTQGNHATCSGSGAETMMLELLTEALENM